MKEKFCYGCEDQGNGWLKMLWEPSSGEVTCTCIANCYLHLRARNQKKNTVFDRLHVLILFVTWGLINFMCLPFFKFLDSTSKFNCQQNRYLDGIQKTWHAQTSNCRSITVSNWNRTRSYFSERNSVSFPERYSVWERLEVWYLVHEKSRGEGDLRWCAALWFA